MSIKHEVLHRDQKHFFLSRPHPYLLLFKEMLPTQKPYCSSRRRSPAINHNTLKGLEDIKGVFPLFFISFDPKPTEVTGKILSVFSELRIRPFGALET